MRKGPSARLARARVRRAYFREGANPVARQFTEISGREIIPQVRENFAEKGEFPAVF